MPTLVSPNFTIGCMMCLQYLSFSVIEDKGYFIVWGIVEFKAFHDSFCCIHHDHIEAAHVVAFLCMYLT